MHQTNELRYRSSTIKKGVATSSIRSEVYICIHLIISIAFSKKTLNVKRFESEDGSKNRKQN